MMLGTPLNERPARLDLLQLLAVLGLMVGGAAFVYSATMVHEPVGFWQQYHELPLPQFFGWLLPQMFFRQIVWYVLGGAAAVVLAVGARRSGQASRGAW